MPRNATQYGPRWDATAEDYDLMDKIADRAITGRAQRSVRQTLLMDLNACHSNGCPMDFARLLAADDFNFWHDVNGIQRHIDRTNGKLLDCFVPRYAVRQGSVRETKPGRS